MTDGASPSGYTLEPLATLPVFFKLAGKTVIVAGGGLPAVWKVELLAATGARVTVLAEAPCDEMIALVARTDAAISLERRLWTSDDMRGAALAIGALKHDEEAEAFRAAAREAGVPVNVVDKPAFCDFQFGTIVARSPLLIGISTEGAAPVFGQAIRTRIEALLPQSLRNWAEAARAWRPAVQLRNFDFRARRRFWETFAQRALAASSEPTEEDRAACFASAEGGAAVNRGGITLVGSGPGTPEALTLAAVGALQAADLILFDREVQSSAVALGRREAEKLEVSDELITRQQALEAFAAGRQVVWLGTGDPTSCRRWSERRHAFDAAAPVIVEGLHRCEVCLHACQFAG